MKESSNSLIWEIKYKINASSSHTHSRIQEDMGIVEDMSKKQSVAGGGKKILQLESKMNGLLLKT